MSTPALLRSAATATATVFGQPADRQRVAAEIGHGGKYVAARASSPAAKRSSALVEHGVLGDQPGSDLGKPWPEPGPGRVNILKPRSPVVDRSVSMPAS
jgi:hypothetical protein